MLTQVTAGTGRIKAQQSTVRRATLLLSSINGFNEDRWDKILQAAATFIPPAAKRRAQSTPAPSSDAPEDVTPEEIIVLSDDDCSDDPEPGDDESDMGSDDELAAFGEVGQ